MKHSCQSSSSSSKDSRSRNAFMQFLCKYRQQQRKKSRNPAWMVAAEAGQVWSKMPLNDKYCYIAAARNAGYMYKARDRRMNRVMRHLRKALQCDDRCDLLQLSQAVKQMQLWKRKMLKEMCDEVGK